MSDKKAQALDMQRRMITIFYEDEKRHSEVEARVKQLVPPPENAKFRQQKNGKFYACVLFKSIDQAKRCVAEAAASSVFTVKYFPDMQASKKRKEQEKQKSSSETEQVHNQINEKDKYAEKFVRRRGPPKAVIPELRNLERNWRMRRNPGKQERHSPDVGEAKSSSAPTKSLAGHNDNDDDDDDDDDDNHHNRDHGVEEEPVERTMRRIVVRNALDAATNGRTDESVRASQGFGATLRSFAATGNGSNHHDNSNSGWSLTNASYRYAPANLSLQMSSEQLPRTPTPAAAAAPPPPPPIKELADPDNTDPSWPRTYRQSER